LIYKVYEVDPLECPRCCAPMQVIALIDDATIIRRILERLGRWAPREVRQNQRAPPKQPPGIRAAVTSNSPGEGIRSDLELRLA